MKNSLNISPNIELKTLLVSHENDSTETPAEIQDLRSLFFKLLDNWLPNESEIKDIQRCFLSSSQENWGQPNKPSTVIKLEPNLDEDETKWDELREMNYLESKTQHVKGSKFVEKVGKNSLGLSVTAWRKDICLLPVAPQLCLGVDINQLNVRDLWTLSQLERVQLVQLILLSESQSKFYQSTQEQDEENEETLNDYLNSWEESKEEENLATAKLLQECRLIGMTITGASINRRVLELVQPSVVIVEEAAEVLEAHLIPILKPYVKHLVLIGDHKQLRPNVETHELVTKYNFDISMMERLILGKMPFVQLKCQNRMRPDISCYLRDIYPELQDGSKVPDIDPIGIFEKSFLFWTHSSPESGSRSYKNEDEADKCVKLAQFLIHQGYQPSQIVILAAYQNQKSLIRSKLKESYGESSTKRTDKIGSVDHVVQVQTIDMYQGDENDIVIVSLVRSNDKGSFGFMKERNRRCVAQSRARKQVVMIGNADFFQKCSEWVNFLDMLRNNSAICTELSITCPQIAHQSASRVLVTDSNRFPGKDFCREPCQVLYPECGHPCDQLCRPLHDHLQCNKNIEYVDLDKCSHTRWRKCHNPEFLVNCQGKCEFVYQACKHECNDICGSTHRHEKCTQLIKDRCHACAHEFTRSCFVPLTSVKCMEEITHECQNCGQSGTKKCYKPVGDYRCEKNCMKKLACGHACPMKCWQNCPTGDTACKFCVMLKNLELKKKNADIVKVNKAIALKLKEELREAQSRDVARLDELRLDDTETCIEYSQVLKRVQGMQSYEERQKIVIEKIEKLHNKKLQINFHDSVQSMISPSFHDTSLLYVMDHENKIEWVKENGLKLTSEELQTNPQKGIELTSHFPSVETNLASNSSIESKIVAVCKVAIGKALTLSVSEASIRNLLSESLTEFNYDSVFIKNESANTVKKDERFVIFKAERILPEYIVRFSYQPERVDAFVVSESGTYQKIRLEHSRDYSSAESRHYNAVASTYYSQMASNSQSNSYPKISAIYYHQNPKLERKFLQEKDSMKLKYPQSEYSSPILGFHGTPRTDNIDKIVKNNFDMSLIKVHVFGKGIYFSEFPETSISYSGSTRRLLLCKLLPGKSFDADCRRTEQPGGCGCDSHRINKDSSGRGWAIVMFNTDRILPCYEIVLASR